MGPHLPNELVGGRYRVLAYVDKGGMQFVYRAQDELLKREVALKTPQNNTAARRFKRSAVVSAQVNHENVAKTLDYFEENYRQYLIEEFIEGTNLAQAGCIAAGFVDPYLAAHIFHHLAKGLAASHRVGVIHRDIKPSNVMVSSDLHAEILKITDFGIAKMAAEELDEAALGGEGSITGSQTAVGALPYMSPEAITSPKTVTVQTDVWSIGAMMFELLCGKKPFGQGLAAVAAIVAGQVQGFPEFTKANAQLKPLADELEKIIRRCLQVNPSARPSASDLVMMCTDLCYPTTQRFSGKLREMRFGKWGFIQLGPEDVFYHRDSFYGPVAPKVDDLTLFAKFVGTGAWRAHPVIKLKSE